MGLSIKNLDRICLVIVIMVTIICGYLATGSTLKQRKIIRQENEMLAKKSADLNVTETNLQHLKTVLNATRTRLKTLNERIPESAKIGNFLKQIDLLIIKRKIDLIRLEPLATVEERLYTKIPVRMVLKGDFINVYRLLCDLETMNRMLIMEKIGVAKSGKKAECRVELKASVFERSETTRERWRKLI